jgi:hypothetical protein
MVKSAMRASAIISSHGKVPEEPTKVVSFPSEGSGSLDKQALDALRRVLSRLTLIVESIDLWETKIGRYRR